MDRDEEIGPRLGRRLAAVGQRQETVVAPRVNHPHPRELLFDHPPQLQGHPQVDGLLLKSVADRPRVLSAVPRVDRDAPHHGPFPGLRHGHRLRRHTRRQQNDVTYDR